MKIANIKFFLGIYRLQIIIFWILANHLIACDNQSQPSTSESVIRDDRDDKLISNLGIKSIVIKGKEDLTEANIKKLTTLEAEKLLKLKGKLKDVTTDNAIWDWLENRIRSLATEGEKDETNPQNTEEENKKGNKGDGAKEEDKKSEIKIKGQEIEAEIESLLKNFNVYKIKTVHDLTEENILRLTTNQALKILKKIVKKYGKSEEMFTKFNKSQIKLLNSVAKTSKLSKEKRKLINEIIKYFVEHVIVNNVKKEELKKIIHNNKYSDFFRFFKKLSNVVTESFPKKILKKMYGIENITFEDFKFLYDFYILSYIATYPKKNSYETITFPKKSLFLNQDKWGKDFKSKIKEGNIQPFLINEIFHFDIKTPEDLVTKIILHEKRNKMFENLKLIKEKNPLFQYWVDYMIRLLNESSLLFSNTIDQMLEHAKENNIDIRSITNRNENEKTSFIIKNMNEIYSESFSKDKLLGYIDFLSNIKLYRINNIQFRKAINKKIENLIYILSTKYAIKDTPSKEMKNFTWYQNSCYLHSGLQMLINLIQMNIDTKQIQKTLNDVNKHMDQKGGGLDENLKDKMNVTIEFLKLYLDYTKEDSEKMLNKINSEKFRNSIKKIHSEFDNANYQGIGEFFLLLVNTIHDTLNTVYKDLTLKIEHENKGIDFLSNINKTKLELKKKIKLSSNFIATLFGYYKIKLSKKKAEFDFALNLIACQKVEASYEYQRIENQDNNVDASIACMSTSSPFNIDKLLRTFTSINKANISVVAIITGNHYYVYVRNFKERNNFHQGWYKLNDMEEEPGIPIRVYPQEVFNVKGIEYICFKN